MTDEDDVVRSKTQQESSDMNCRTNTDTWNDHSVLDVAVTDHSQGHSNILPSNHLHAAKASSLSRGLTSVEPVSSSNDDDSTDVTTGGVTTMLPQPPPLPISTWESDKWQTLASVAGNVLEWFDFAIFGYLSDILGEVFFPPSKTASSTADDHTTGTTKQQTLESFFVFGLAFLMRPIGGLLFGYIGDYYGRKKALVISIFTMAFPTFLMGTLPGYKRVGKWAIAFLILVRLLQGLSVGGQLVSSLVYLLENKDPNHWGFYGSFTMAAAIFGSLLGGMTSFTLRAVLSNDQLVTWGWRIPFLCGIFVSYFGVYLRNHGADHDGYHVPHQSEDEDNNHRNIGDNDTNDEIHAIDPKFQNPLRDAFRRKNLRLLLAASLVPMLWSSAFYLTFVWMPIFMAELSDNTVPGAFLINTISLFLSLCLAFPVAGMLSDNYGRVRTMTIGGTTLAVLSPLLVIVIGKGKPALALLSQCIMGISLSLFSAPMCAWLVEAFEPKARLTSVAVGYNLAQALAGGITPFLATLISNDLGQQWPGWIITVVATMSMVGLLCVAPDKQLKTRDILPDISAVDRTTIESDDGIL